MDNFIFQNPVKLLFGKGQVSTLADELKKYGNHVLVVYGGGSIKKNGVYDDVMKVLNDGGLTVTEFGGVEPNPRLSTAIKAAELCKRENIDVIVAVGGGSVIDCTKLIASAAKYDGNPWDFVIQKAHPKEALPFGTVLTLSATSSEMNAGSVITNEETQEKFGWGGPLNFPKFSILDPSYTVSVPMDQTVNGVVDTMSHIFEEYFNESSNTPFQDEMCESALRTLIETGAEVVKTPDDYELRATMMLAGVWGLNGFLRMGYVGDWGTHDIEHAVSAVYDIPHAGGLSILFPEWMRYTMHLKPARYAQLAVKAFGVDPTGKTDEEIAVEGITKLEGFWSSIGAPRKLKDFDIDDSKIDLMAEKASARGPLGNFAKLGKEDVVQILTNCL